MNATDNSSDTSSTDTSSLDVTHDEEASRYELRRSGEAVGVIDYRRNGDVVEMFHTEIHTDARGQGLGAVLVRQALDDVRQRGERVLPSCWYVRDFIGAHRAYADLLAD